MRASGARATSRPRAHVINLVNTFFRAKLEGVPTIREYIEQMQQH